MKVNDGSIFGYIQPAHNENNLDVVSQLVAPLVPANWGVRVCSAGVKLRSTASFSTEGGMIHAYTSPLPTNYTYSVYRDSPNTFIYSKGEVAEVRYIPFDLSELTFAAKFNNASFSTIFENHHLGFMILGGTPGTMYTLQYSITFEYVTNSNTDLVPHRQSDEGDPVKVLRLITHNNTARPSTWTLATPQASKLAHDISLASMHQYHTAGSMGGSSALGALSVDHGNGAFTTNFPNIPRGNLPLMIGNGM